MSGGRNEEDVTPFVGVWIEISNPSDDVIDIISIHTPTKGVTRSNHGVPETSYISIHTPTKGVTDSLLPYQNGINNFNPHSHEGSDA